MPEHGPVPPRTRRGSSSRPLAAVVSAALALLGTTALALPASAEDTPPDPLVTIAPVAGDGETPVEPTASPSPTDEPTPTPSESAPASSGALGPAPMLAALSAAIPLAAPAAAPSVPTITGPGDITVNVGDNLNSLSLAYTASGPGTDRMNLSQRGTRPPGVTWSSGGAKFTGRPTVAGQWALTIELSDNRGRVQATMAVTFTVTGPPTISGDDFSPNGELGDGFQEDYTLGGYPLPTSDDVSVTGLPSGLSASVSGTRLRISGTPAEAGRFTATVTATVAGRTALRNLTITIYGLDIATVPELRLTRGVAMTPVLIPVDAYPGDFDWDRGALPPGLTVKKVAGGLEISGTPAWSGTRTFDVYAETWYWFSVWYDDATITVTAGNAPTISVASARTVVAGQAMAPIPIMVNPSNAAVLVDSTLPTGVTFPSDGTGRTLSGTPARAAMGVHDITFNATNDFGTASATLRLTVQAAPVITAPDQAFTSGGDATHTVTAEAWPPAQLSVRAGDLPAGLTADGSTRGRLVISGSTTALGTSTIHVTASNGVGPAVQTTYALSIVKAPVFAEHSVALTVDAGAPMTPVVLEAQSYPPHTVTMAPGSAPLPAGLTLDATTGTLAGTPTTGAAGVHTVTVRAENGQGHDDLALEITVLAAPDIASTSGSRTFQLDQASAFTLTTSGWLPPAVTMTGLPAGLTLEQVDATTWRVSGTVTDPAELGAHTVRATLTNSQATVTRTMTVRVEGFTFTGGPTDLVVEAGVPMEPFVVTSAAFPGSAFISPTTLPSGMSCGFVNGSWSFPTPTEPGTDTWRCSGTLSTVGTLAVVFRSDVNPQAPVHTVTIRVLARPVIDAPATATVVADADVSIPVTVTGDPAPTSVTASGLPDGLSIQPVAGGGWAIVGRVERSAVGGHDVTISADNGLAATRSLALTVESAPVLPTGDVTLVVGTPHTGSVTADGSPAPALQMTDGDLPDGLTWSATGAVGTLEGTPTETGVWTYTVTATNVHGTTAQTYHVEVQQAATFADDALSLTMIEGVPDARTLPLVGFPHPVVTTTGAIPGMTVDHTAGTDPVLSGTPAAGSAGTYTLELSAGNHTVLGDTTDVLTIEVTVLAAPALLSGTDPLEATVASALDRPLVVGGAPAPTLTATGLPTGVELVQDPPGQWHLVGVPAPGTGGRYEVALTADNGVLTPATATMTLTVLEPVTQVVAPVANLRVGTPAVVTVRAHGGWPAPAALRVEGTLPAGLRFVDQGDGTGQVLGTPAVGTAGSWQVTIVGDNGVGTARTTLTLTVTAPPATAPARTPAPAGAPADPTGATPAPVDTEANGPTTGTGSGDGDGGEGATGTDDTQAAPPVLDPEETITVERTPRPWWWILGAAFVGAVLIGLRALERKLRSL